MLFCYQTMKNKYFDESKIRTYFVIQSKLKKNFHELRLSVSNQFLKLNE
jgi:hypothetical protein